MCSSDLTRFARRITAACSGVEPEEEIEKPTAAQGVCGNCRKPNMALAPFCIHCGSRITAPPPSSVVPSPIPPPILPPPAAAPPPPQIKPPAPPPVPQIGQATRQDRFVAEIDGWRRSSVHQITVKGQQYRVCGQKVDTKQPDWVHYGLEGRDGNLYGVSVHRDGSQGPLVHLVEDDAEPITRYNVPALCSRTGQVFIYGCEWRGDSSDGYWLEVVDATIPQNRAAASALASARMADVHGLFKIASGFTGCPHCLAKSFTSCHCGTVSCDGMKRYENGKEQIHCEGCGTWGYITRGAICEIHALEQQPVNERKELSVRRSDR